MLAATRKPMYIVSYTPSDLDSQCIGGIIKASHVVLSSITLSNFVVHATLLTASSMYLHVSRGMIFFPPTMMITVLFDLFSHLLSHSLPGLCIRPLQVHSRMKASFSFHQFQISLSSNRIRSSISNPGATIHNVKACPPLSR